MITIYEPPVRNSGRMSGKFLAPSRIARPGCSPENPDYYGPADFYIGAVVQVFSHRFVITNADAYVLDFMKENPRMFPGIITFILNVLVHGQMCYTCITCGIFRCI